MKYDNEMTLTVSSKSCNESFARSAVGAFCAQLNPTIEEIGDIKTAVSEAVTNSIVHGYNYEENGKIDIWVGLNVEKKRRLYQNLRPRQGNTRRGKSHAAVFHLVSDRRKVGNGIYGYAGVYRRAECKI